MRVALPDAVPAIPHQSLAAVFRRFLRFGCLAWGGPVAQIAMIQRELVEHERWITPDRFRRALAVYQVLPGPEAHELCVWFGMLARGRAGAVLAGLGFMLPGFLLMFGLCALYAHGVLRGAALGPALAGLQAAVVALIVRALARMGRHALHDHWLAAIAALAMASQLLGVHFGLALAFGGAGSVLVRRRAWPAAALLALLFGGWTVAQAILGSASPDAATVLVPGTGEPAAAALFASGLRSGLLTFGGAYTVIPFLQHDAVVVGAWMTKDQFLDGVALSGVLPAPLIIFATFVGYVGGGPPGAVVMTAGIFLPAFCFTLVGHGLFERLTDNVAVHRFLDGVTAAVIGLMVATTVQLLDAGIVDLRTAAIAAGALVALWRWQGRAAVPIVMLCAGLLGSVLLQE